MIKNTFIFIPGIGEKTEKKLWDEGIFNWDYLKTSLKGIFKNSAKRKKIQYYLHKAYTALENNDVSFFAKHLPTKEYWRLYNIFSKKILFLDIESTGLSLYYDKITLIGTYNGVETKFFIKGVNLKDIIDYLSNYDIIITFNGKVFDVPFIKKELKKIKIPLIHIDLRFLLRSMGITGSLKKVEEKLKISRPQDLKEVDGRRATILWSKFLIGKTNNLELLLLYNSYDITNLQKIMDFYYMKKLYEIKSKVNCHFFKAMYEQLRDEYNIKHILTPNIEAKSYKNKVKIKINNKIFLDFDRDNLEKTDLRVGHLIRKLNYKKIKPLSVGLDLSGSEERHSGICILDNKSAYLDIVKTNKEIISKIIDIKPSIISIDSPLSIPYGRCCADDSCSCRKFGIMRECERILKRRGINVYPCLIKSMQKLTLRGIYLADFFRKRGYNVIESYPGAAQDILGFPRKRVDLDELKISLSNMEIEYINSINKNKITHDEIDALTSALVGYFYLADDYEALGNSIEGYLIIPKIKHGKI